MLKRFVLASVVLLAACGGGGKSTADTAGSGGVTIAVIPKGTSHVF